MRRINHYIHQLQTWPVFHWDKEKLADQLTTLHYHQGKILGRMEGLGFRLRDEAMLQTLSLDVIKSSEIEGEILNPKQVRSSIARHLGLNIAGLVPSDSNVDGVVEMMLNATQQYRAPLASKRLFSWHKLLFPKGGNKSHALTIGTWRDNPSDSPMQVVSGPLGRESVHFEAPDSACLQKEMAAFFDWFNNTGNLNPVVKAGVAHLWFITVHPFDDGNGRMARAITDLQLARADGSPQRFYSMSSQIRIERNEYYDALEKTQHGSLDITGWLSWFLGCLDRAMQATDKTLANVLSKARFWEKHSSALLNERQRKMINLLFDGFEGNLTSTKWAKLTKCSHDTALRDITDLTEKHILVKESAGGRSTSYALSAYNIK